MASSANPKAERLALRLHGAAKERLRHAAEIRHVKLSTFVMDAALREADQVLADRTRFELDAEQWDAFSAALDSPASVTPHAGTVSLFATPSVTEKHQADRS